MSIPNQPSEAELEILKVLWKHPGSTVRFVHEKISALREVGYTTTLKQMQRMQEKGLISRIEGRKPHHYSATVKEADVKNALFKKFLTNVFDGSSLKLALHALGQSKTAPEELEALEKYIKEQKAKNDE